MSELHSVTELIEELQKDDSYAARKIYDRFMERLIGAAKRRLGNMPRQAVDEEDVALAAFDAFLRGVKEDRFKKLADREDLWQILVMLTERKAIAARRHAHAKKRGGGIHLGESVFGNYLADCSAGGPGGIANVADPVPAVVDEFTLGVRELLEMLDDDTQRSVATLRLEGFTNKEIADQLGIALRAVERKVQLIRKRWENYRP